MNAIEHTMNAVALLISPIVGALFRRPARHDEALEMLRKRAEAHAAACADLDDDPLIQAAFGRPEALKPMKTPIRAGFMLARQAD